jgi:hypothetical protein
MIFTRLGYVLSIVAVLTGILMIFSGVRAEQGGYAPWYGYGINAGAQSVIFGIALGILAEIRLALRA